MVSSRHGRSQSLRRSSSVLRSGKYSKSSTRESTAPGLSRYLDNSVVAFEEFGEAQSVLKLYEFKDKKRTSEKLKKSVLVEIEASTVSMTDVLIRRDLWHQKVKHPCKSGCDLVGRVINAGYKCDDVKIGDRICAVGLALGGNAKYAILPASRVFCCPEDIHPTTVACLVRNYMAAYQCLHRAGGVKIRPGSKVLVVGGAGAFGQAIIQLAVAAGADEIFATGKGSNSRRIIENLGGQALGRKPGEWLPYVKGEMDIVIDSVCTDDYVSSMRAVKRKTGKLVCVGATALSRKSYNWNSGIDPGERFRIVELSSSMAQTSFYDVFSSVEMKRDTFKKDLFRLFHLCRNNEITPKVAFCVPLEEVGNAQLDLEAGGIDGSIVCLPFGAPGRQVDVIKSDVDITKVYDDGITMRESILGGELKPQYGKVMKDGTFKVLSTTKRGFEDYDDDDLYSRVGNTSPPRNNSTPGIRRVDSSPWALQDDMDQSYHRAMFDDEDDDDDDDDNMSRYSSYTSRNNPRQGKDSYRQGPPPPRGNRRVGGSRRSDMEELDHHVSSSRVPAASGGYRRHNRSSSRRPSDRGNIGGIDDDDRSVHSVKSVLRNGKNSRPQSRGGNFEDSYNSKRRSSSRNPSNRQRPSRGYTDEDDYGERGGSSRPTRSKYDDDDNSMALRRTPSILRNSTRNRPQSRGVSQEPSKRATPEPAPSSRNRTRARSRDPRGPQPSSRPRGRTRSRSMDSRSAREESRHREESKPRESSRPRARSQSRGGARGHSKSRREPSPSPSVQSSKSIGSEFTKNSEFTTNSEYSTKNDASVYSTKSSDSVETKDTDYVPSKREKNKEKEKSRRNRTRSDSRRGRPKAEKEVPKKEKSKKKLFGRLRSRSRTNDLARAKEEMKKTVISKHKKDSRSKPRIPPTLIKQEKSRSKKMSSREESSRLASPRKRSESKHRGESKSRHSEKDKRREKDRSSRKERSSRVPRDSDKKRGRRSSSYRDDVDDNKSIVSSKSLIDDDESKSYEEDAVRSVVSLNCASEDTLSESEESIEKPPLRSPRRASSGRKSSSLRSSSRVRSSSRRRHDDDY